MNYGAVNVNMDIHVAVSLYFCFRMSSIMVIVEQGEMVPESFFSVRWFRVDENGGFYIPSARNKCRSSSSLPKCYFEGVKGP